MSGNEETIVLHFKPNLSTKTKTKIDDEISSNNTYTFSDKESVGKKITPFPTLNLPPITVTITEEKIEKREENKKEENKKEDHGLATRTKVGRGTYGNVYKCGEGTVVKTYKILENGIQTDMVREISVMKMFSHPNILSCLSYDLNRKEILMPAFTYNLTDYMQDYSLNSEMIQTIFYSCCKALYVLHSRNIVHRDVKPDNILLNVKNRSGDMSVVLCDYGMSRPIKGDMTSKVCTLWYRPFEMFVGHKDYRTELDIWSLGCVLGEMLLEEPLFPYKRGIDMIQHQLKLLGTPTKCDFNFKNIKLPKYKGEFDKIFYNVESDSKFILKRMLDCNPETRITISEILTFITDTRHTSAHSLYTDFLKGFSSPPFMISNFIINEEERTILVDWLMDLRFNSSLEFDDYTYFRAVSIMDQYIHHLNEKGSINENGLNKQLVAACCLWLSGKIEGRMDETEIVEFGAGAYSLLDLVKMEKEIITALDFNFLKPLLIDYLEFYDSEIYYELMNRIYAVTLTTDFHAKSLKQVVKDCYDYEEEYVMKCYTDYKARQFAV